MLWVEARLGAKVSGLHVAGCCIKGLWAMKYVVQELVTSFRRSSQNGRTANNSSTSNALKQQCR